MTHVSKMVEENLFSVRLMSAYIAAGSFLTKTTESASENSFFTQGSEDLR